MPRNYLLTGASRGLGLEIARVLLHQGDSVWAVSRSETDELRSLAKTYGAQLKLLLFDLARVDMLKGEIFDSFVTSKTPLHGFVNNAAIAYDDIVTNLNLDPLRKMFEVNVFAPMLATKFVLRNMLLHNVRGAVVHVSSISVHTGYKGLAMYAASKGALEAFSKNTAREWGERGIRSNALVAGFMETAMSGKIDAGTKSRIFARTALKKPTELRSVAETAAFLLGEGASSITGQAIHVDSGTI